MFRAFAAILLLVAAAAAVISAKPTALPYFPCNTSTRGMSTIDLIKYSGTWFTVATTIPLPGNNTVPPDQIQAQINKAVGCSRSRFNLTNANNLNITQDLVMRIPIPDNSVFPPDTQFINGNEARYRLPARPASLATPNDAHWIVDVYNKTGSTSVDLFNIATDYKDWAVWYVCTAPSNVPQQVEQWGVWSRAPKPYNTIKKLAFKSLARLAGIDIAFTDYLYDIPQDMCF